MNFNRIASRCAAAIALAALPTAALHAQAAAPQAPAASAEAEAAVEIGDTELRQFAGAVVELGALNAEYSPRIEAASAEEQPAIQQEAQGRAMAIVQKHQLEPATFNGIAQAAQQDPELAQRIDTYVREIAGAPTN